MDSLLITLVLFILLQSIWLFYFWSQYKLERKHSRELVEAFTCYIKTGELPDGFGR